MGEYRSIVTPIATFCVLINLIPPRFVGKDGCVYGIPQRSSGVLRIIPPGIQRYGRNGVALPKEEECIDIMYAGDDMVSCKDKFEGGVLGQNGKIYCIPLRAKAFVIVTPGESA